MTNLQSDEDIEFLIDKPKSADVESLCAFFAPLRLRGEGHVDH